MFNRTHGGAVSHLLTVLVAISLLMAACYPAVPATTQPDSTMASAPMATLEPTATTAPPATAVLTPDSSPQFSLETGGMATGFQSETVAAVSAGDNAPYWEVLPAYTRVTLQGYPISSHLMQPQIFIYPAEELGAVNEGAGTMVSSLQALLQSPQDMPTMPFLPPFNATQVMHTHLQYLDFKGGQGLRYLTEYDQGLVPVNNYELIYTYQGLTSDGKYYVAAVLPVNHPSLPADAAVTGNEPAEFTSDFPTYLANVASSLNPQGANTFTPDLTQLDAMMSSLEVK